MKKIYLCLLFLFIPLIIAAQALLPEQTRVSEGIDYNSFYPHILLRHEVGTFFKLPKNPVFRPARQGWDSRDVADPFITVSTDTVTLWYDGSSGGSYHIGRAVLDKDGWYWQRSGREEITPTTGYTYHLIAPAFIPGAGQAMLLLNGNDSDSELGYRLGLARKTERSWHIKDLELSIPQSGNWDNSGRAYATVLYLPEKRQRVLYYSGFSGLLSSIGRAEQNAKGTWRTGNKPVYNALPGVIAPHVIYNGRNFTMYYVRLNLNSGFGSHIEKAVSDDGINWHFRDVVLKPEKRWEGRRLMRPHLSYYEGSFHLFYCAQRGSNWRIGEARAGGLFRARGSVFIKIENTRRLIIDYEQTPGTALELWLNGGENRKKISTQKQARRRADVWRVEIDTTPYSGKTLEVELISEKGTASPVIYRIERH